MSRIPFLLRCLLLGGLLTFAYWNVNFPVFLSYFSREMLVASLAVQPLVLMALCAGGWRLALLARTPRVPLGTAFNAMTLALGMNLLTPGRVSELLKVTYLRDRASVPLSSGLAALVFERILDLAIIGVMIGIGIVLAAAIPNAFLLALAVLSLAGMIAIVKSKPVLMRLIDRFRWARARSFAYGLLERASAILTAPVFFPALGLGAVMWLLSMVKFVLFLQLAGAGSLTFHESFVIFLAALIGGAIPALPGGFGTYEAAVVFVLRGYGYSFEEALSLALGVHLGLHILILPLALVIAARHNLGVRAVLRETLVEIKRRSHDEGDASFGKPPSST